MGIPVELQKQPGYVATVNLIADLLAFVSPDGVWPPGNSADNDVGQVTVQFDCGVLWAGKTAAAEDTYRHVEVTSELLAHDVGCYLGSAKDRVQAVVDRHSFV